MILLADNDIVLKLAGCNLLNIFKEIVCQNNEQICLLPTAQFWFPKNINKKLEKESSKIEVNDFLNTIKYLENEVDNVLLNRLSIDKIDSGEALLFAHAYCEPNSYIATGDKNSLRVLLTNSELTDIKAALEHRVYTLETTLLILMKELGFQRVSQLVIERGIKDKVLEMAFGMGRDETHAIECLSSYVKELLPLLVKAELVKID